MTAQLRQFNNLMHKIVQILDSKEVLQHHECSKDDKCVRASEYHNASFDTVVP